MKLHQLLTLAATLMLASCTTSQDVPPKAVPAPIQAAAVAPLVDQTKVDAGTASGLTISCIAN